MMITSSSRWMMMMIINAFPPRKKARVSHTGKLRESPMIISAKCVSRLLRRRWDPHHREVVVMGGGGIAEEVGIGCIELLLEAVDLALEVRYGPHTPIHRVSDSSLSFIS